MHACTPAYEVFDLLMDDLPKGTGVALVGACSQC